VQGLSRDTNSHSDGQEIPLILWNSIQPANGPHPGPHSSQYSFAVQINPLLPETISTSTAGPTHFVLNEANQNTGVTLHKMK